MIRFADGKFASIKSRDFLAGAISHNHSVGRYMFTENF